jgi:hypothetical protein
LTVVNPSARRRLESIRRVFSRARAISPEPCCAAGVHLLHGEDVELLLVVVVRREEIADVVQRTLVLVIDVAASRVDASLRERRARQRDRRRQAVVRHVDGVPVHVREVDARVHGAVGDIERPRAQERVRQAAVLVQVDDLLEVASRRMVFVQVLE